MIHINEIPLPKNNVAVIPVANEDFDVVLRVERIDGLPVNHESGLYSVEFQNTEEGLKLACEYQDLVAKAF